METYNVCSILQDKGPKGAYKDYSGLPPILQWFDVLESSLIVDDPFKTNIGASNYTVLVPHVLQLLRFCFLTRRDVPAITLLNLLAEEPKKFIDLIWRGVTELVFHNPEQYKPFLDQLVNQLKQLVEINAKEVLLDFLLCVLHQGQITEAKYIFTDIPKQKLTTVTEHMKQTDILCKAYQGLVFYVEWTVARNKTQRLRDLGDQLDDDVSENFEDFMRSCADKALNFFDVLKDLTGVWDIFVTKQVEMLEYYDKQEEAEDVLQAYKEQNKENPNTHKYLYQFAVRHQWSTSSKISLLKDLAVHVPSDPLVIDLCAILIKEDKATEAAHYLFNLLDDGSWQFELQPWKLMSEILTSEVKSRNVIEECMDDRKLWWPQYHFSSTCNSSSQLCLHKATCCLILDPNNTEFLRRVRSMLSTEEEEQLSSMEERMQSLSGVT
ncbi:TATA box-binding protein-associated factor RNA polymerase I subunit A-like isoform X2 [Ostrea edulis]|uniref:TATA box-binding protein-associated factor RNA polymerase I subunit A-like isoform X2 n=1 Tax=Ostrea edulis TaxID=37623 RepID=UPI0024AF7857|nr:TATA box-binding protein-associated factor RNA polymerase I subunit A-like isoform X2 [Ostrea edulis]